MGKLAIYRQGTQNFQAIENTVKCLLNPQQFESLRLKIIERLLKEGSCADEPINIPLSDYSSDEGASSGSDNEGRAGSSKGFSDLEGPCCYPMRAPPCSPDLEMAEIRRFKYGRMKKIMHELDRIYFQPLFHKYSSFLFKMRNSKPAANYNKKGRIMKKSNSKKFKKSATKLETVSHSKQICGEMQTQNSQARVLPKSKSLQILRKTESSSDVQQEPEVSKKKNIKVSRTLRLWLKKRQILIQRRKRPKQKIRRFNRRKKQDDRQLLDLPCTDPTSELVFSTDDEYIADANGNAAANAGGFNTMPRVRRNLMQSELQRRYIEEIGDGIRKMPPELIITSPNNPVQIRYRSVMIDAAGDIDKSSESLEHGSMQQSFLEFPSIGEPARRINSWHNLHNGGSAKIQTIAAPPTLLITAGGKHTTKKQNLSPSYRSLNKKELMSKEDLDIKLSLKKKIWSGLQPDDSNQQVDRNRPLSWIVPPLKLPITQKKQNNPNNRSHGGGGGGAVATPLGNTKRISEAFLTACTEKLLKWQNTNTETTDKSLPATPRETKRLSLNYSFSDVCVHQASVQNLPGTKKFSKSSPKAKETKSKQKKSTITKLAETTKLLNKIGKTKSSRNSLTAATAASAHRSMPKQNSLHHKRSNSQQHEAGIQGNKFKTGGIVATAVQPIGAAKRNKKLKSLQNHSNKLADSHCLDAGVNANAKSNIISRATTATTIVRKVKTKLKKKKSPITILVSSANSNQDDDNS